MSLAVIKDNHITFMGTKYFIANAQTASIGSGGEKATPVFGQNKIEVKTHIPAPKLEGKVKTLPPISIDSQKSSKSNFSEAVSASLKVIGFSGSKDLVYEKLTENKLKLVQLLVEDETMKKAANDSPKFLKNLESYGGDARIVHQLFVVMEAEFAESFTKAASYDVSADAFGIVSIEANGGSSVSGKDKITLSENTGIAYLLLKPDWNKDRTKIEKVKVDEWSVN